MLDHWWVAEAWEISPVFLVSWIVWVIGSIILHELGHGWAAIRCGDRTPIETGHMTWNPLIHMGPTSLVMFAVFGFTWGMMPVNPNRFRGRHDDAVVAAAGPAMNLGLGVTCVVLHAAWIGGAGGYWFGVSAPDRVFDAVGVFLRVGVFINVMGVLFNLIPVPPLDGSRILASVFPPFRAFLSHEHGRMIALVAFGLLFFVGADPIWGVVFDIGHAAMDAAIQVMVPNHP
jgi:Zn-dependent protease